jgi:hypothetical protein
LPSFALRVFSPPSARETLFDAENISNVVRREGIVIQKGNKLARQFLGLQLAFLLT